MAAIARGYSKVQSGPPLKELKRWSQYCTKDISNISISQNYRRTYISFLHCINAETFIRQGKGPQCPNWKSEAWNLTKWSINMAGDAQRQDLVLRWTCPGWSDLTESIQVRCGNGGNEGRRVDSTKKNLINTTGDDGGRQDLVLRWTVPVSDTRNGWSDLTVSIQVRCGNGGNEGRRGFFFDVTPVSNSLRHEKKFCLIKKKKDTYIHVGVECRVKNRVKTNYMCCSTYEFAARFMVYKLRPLPCKAQTCAPLLLIKRDITGTFLTRRTMSLLIPELLQILCLGQLSTHHSKQLRMVHISSRAKRATMPPVHRAARLWGFERRYESLSVM